MAYMTVLHIILSAETVESHDKSQSLQLLTPPRFESDISQTAVTCFLEILVVKVNAYGDTLYLHFAKHCVCCTATLSTQYGRTEQNRKLDRPISISGVIAQHGVSSFGSCLNYTSLIEHLSSVSPENLTGRCTRAASF